MTAEQTTEMMRAFTAFKETNDQLQKEVAKYGKESSELRERLTRLQGVLDDYEAMGNRKAGGPVAGFYSGGTKTVYSESKQLLFAALRGKAVSLEDMQSKALLIGNDAAGGYLAPLEYVNEIVKSTVEFSPIRSVARIRSTTRPGVQVPTRTTTASASWVAETGTRSETTNPGFGLEELRTHELYAMVKISKQELEDAAFDVEQFLREEFSEQFGSAEGTAFVSGSGSGRPEGLLASVSIGTVNTGHASEITADGLIALYFGVKSTYAANGVWLLNRDSLRAIRQLKDGVGQYLWSPGIKDAARPAEILGRPYLECPDMPAIGADTYPVLFGDMRRAYLIVDRLVIEILVDPYSGKSSGMVEISARRRVGGQVVLAEAIKKLKIAA